MGCSLSTREQRDGEYQTGFIRWRAAENAFDHWTLNGVKLNTSGEPEFDPGTATADADPYEAGTYNGGNYYNGGSFLVGEWISPEVTAAFPYKNAIASRNASTPKGSWIEVKFRANYRERWSTWYVLGIWAADTSSITRHSVKEQKDADATVADDTFVSLSEDSSTDKFQLKFRLFSTDGAARPCLMNASVA